jgi:hypothetical protein
MHGRLFDGFEAGKPTLELVWVLEALALPRETRRVDPGLSTSGSARVSPGNARGDPPTSMPSPGAHLTDHDVAVGDRAAWRLVPRMTAI